RRPTPHSAARHDSGGARRHPLAGPPDDRVPSLTGPDGRTTMMFRWLREQRGSILLFTTVLVVPLMIIFAGLAMDMAYYGTVDDELQRAMDAAALAGAGKLGFDSSAFPTVRSFAQNYATANPFKTGSIHPSPNTPHEPAGRN